MKLRYGTSVGQTGVLAHFATGRRRGGPCSGTRNFRYGLVGHFSILDWCLVEKVRAGPLLANGLADAIYDPKSWVSVGVPSPSRGRGERLTACLGPAHTTAPSCAPYRYRHRVRPHQPTAIYWYKYPYTKGGKSLRTVVVIATATVTTTVMVTEVTLLNWGWLRCAACQYSK